jgi:hypothetical protein
MNNKSPILKSTPSLKVKLSLRQRFDSLGIQINSRVFNALKLYHSSQVHSALNHVEANFELIQSPLAVFLYQLPKQPIEENKPLLPVYTARDFPGYTLHHLKSMYPTHWQSAARHFGVPLS